MPGRRRCGKRRARSCAAWLPRTVPRRTRADGAHPRRRAARPLGRRRRPVLLIAAVAVAEHHNFHRRVCHLPRRAGAPLPRRPAPARTLSSHQGPNSPVHAPPEDGGGRQTRRLAPAGAPRTTQQTREKKNFAGAPSVTARRPPARPQAGRRVRASGAGLWRHTPASGHGRPSRVCARHKYAHHVKETRRGNTCGCWAPPTGREAG